MEDLFIRFPKIGHQIFVKLTNQELVKCRKVSKTLKSFVDKTKIMSVRKIEKYCHPSYDQGNSLRGIDNKTFISKLKKI